MSELKVIKIELNNHGKPIASIQGTTSYYGISPNDTFYPQAEADKVIAEKDKEIAELKARIQLDDDEMAGFLQLEEECGGGDLRNYIAELKNKLEDVQASAYAESVDAGMRERSMRKALWLARAELCRRLDVDRYLRKHRNSWYNENYLTWNKACVAMEVKMCKAESKCRAMADKYGEEN